MPVGKKFPNKFQAVEGFMKKIGVVVALLLICFVDVAHGVKRGTSSGAVAKQAVQPRAKSKKRGTSSGAVAKQAVQPRAKSKKRKYSAIKTRFFYKGASKLLPKIAQMVTEDLRFTDQFEIELKKAVRDSEKVSTKKLFASGISMLGIFNVTAGTKLSCTIRDTNSNALLFEKTFVIDKKNIVLQSHTLSSDIIKALTGEQGVCLSSIAYCKKLSQTHKVICISDYACKQCREVVSRNTINIAPSWHTQAPVLFYSQMTRSNSRLMSVNLKNGVHNVICSYPGLSMQPSFTADGSKAVICLSGGRGNSELYLYDPRLRRRFGKKVFIQLTKNGGHNVSPCVLPNNDVVFCSNFETGSPQIYYFFIKTKKCVRLTSGRGYCAAPAYCVKTNMLTYIRPIRGQFQLYTLSLDNIYATKETKITHCVGSKQEPSWSECGRYIIFSIDRPNSKKQHISQIGILNYKSGKIRVMTHDPHPKSFPRWTRSTQFCLKSA
jgi:tol-pal system beta propeller repeat protein TolB